MLQLGAFLRSIRHVRPASLFHRARILLQNRIEERLPLPPSKVPLPRSPTPPLPLFEARSGQVRHEGHGAFATFLGREIPLETPLDWAPALPQLDLMHLHYMEYLEDLNAETALPLVLDWIRSNPPRRHQAWRSSWSSYALSLRVVVWMQSWVRRGWDPAPEEAAQLHRSLSDQIRHLASHLEVDIRGNHLIKNLKALLWASQFFEGPEAEKWGAMGAALLAEELETQILPDGTHFELSPSYHLQVLSDLIECQQLLPTGALKTRLERHLQSMAKAAAWLSHPDGAPSLFGDGGLHMARRLTECCRAFAPLEAVCTTPSPSVFMLEAAGYFGFHASGECLIVDCGPIAAPALPAHGHGDPLAFEWSVGGRRVVVDSGVYEYQAGPRRARARGSQAHNTVTLDGMDVAEFWGSFRLGRRPHPRLHAMEVRGAGFHLQGSHDGYANLPGAPIHVRTYDARPHRIEVRDVIQGGRGQRVEARLHLHPDLDVRLEDGGAQLSAPGLQVQLRSPAAIALESGPWWPDLGLERPSLCLVLTYGAAPCEGGFTLEAYTDPPPSFADSPMPPRGPHDL